MPRIIAIDFGLKRTGLAISDPMGMIANGLETVSSDKLMEKLLSLKEEFGFETVVIGYPKRMNGEDSSIEANIQLLIGVLRKKFIGIRIERFDERFTSKLAQQAMIAAGAKKSQRMNKGNLDKISATLILQDYLNQQP